MEENIIRSMTDLDSRIQVLKVREAMQLEALKDQFSALKESIKPTTLIKDTYNEFMSSKTMRQNAMDTTMGLATGWITKKLFRFGNSNNIFKKGAGLLLQAVTTGIITKKMPVIRERISDIAKQN